MPAALLDRAIASIRANGLVVAFVLVTAALTLAYYAPLPQLVREASYVGVGLLTGAAILVGVRVHRPEHPAAWYLLAAGTWLFAAGDIAWTVLGLLGEVPYPSVADVLYLLGYPALAIAFLHAIVVRVHGGDSSGLLDAAIVTMGAVLVGYVQLLRPVLDTPGDALSIALGVAYPLGDLVILGVAIGMLATPGRRGAAFGVLLASLGIMFVGDMIYAQQVAAETFVDGSALDLTWLASYAALGVAALLPSMRLVASPNPVRIAWLRRTRLLFLTAAMLTGPALMLAHADDDVPLLVGGWVVLALMVVLRLATTVGALARDNAARRSLEDELSYRATHDPLTGLANRRAFLEHLDRALAERAAALPGRTSDPVTVLFLDLDDFKAVNDTLGHQSGDALLVAVARRIRGHLRPGDVAARMGGDEFGILLRADESVAARIGQRVLDAFREPVSLGGRPVTTRGSIGVTQARDGEDVASLLADADVAMYQAKAQGKNQVCAFRAEMRDDVADRMQLEADLRAGIAGDGLSLDWQPIVDLHTGDAVGVEALVRWHHPTRGALAPSVFIPFAEATGQGRALGIWVLEAACEQVARWRQALDPDLCLAVNLAPRQLAGTDLVAIAWSAAQRAGLPMSALIVDVTEGALLLDAPEVAANLAALRALGSRVALDDFGTGYSSLSHLGRLPVDILKIDRAFVDGLHQDEDRSLAGIVVNLAETLGLETIAEGIERPEQLDAVKRLGCRLGQGYHLAPPSTAAAFEARYAPDPGTAQAPRAPRPAHGAAHGSSVLPRAGLPFAPGA